MRWLWQKPGVEQVHDGMLAIGIEVYRQPVFNGFLIESAVSMSIGIAQEVPRGTHGIHGIGLTRRPAAFGAGIYKACAVLQRDSPVGLNSASSGSSTGSSSSGTGTIPHFWQ